MACAGVAQSAAQNGLRLVVHKAAVGHTVAARVGGAVIGLGGIVGGDRERCLRDRPDGPAGTGGQCVVAQHRGACRCKVAAAERGGHGLACACVGVVKRARGFTHAGALTCCKAGQSKVTRRQGGSPGAVVDLGGGARQVHRNGRHPCWADGQGAVCKVHRIVAAGQTRWRDGVAACIACALACAGVAQSAAQNGLRLVVHKTAVGHTVAACVGGAVIGLGRVIGRHCGVGLGNVQTAG